jgi:two-component system, chemotaxis family, chemotaxis protein CheY
MSISRRILIVDDEPGVRSFLRCFLEYEGYTVVAEAENGREAVELYCLCRPDITIMDIDMPLKSGVCAAEEIIAMDRTAEILFCSGGNSSEVLVSAASGVNACRFISKPFKTDQMLEILGDMAGCEEKGSRETKG